MIQPLVAPLFPWTRSVTVEYPSGVRTSRMTLAESRSGMLDASIELVFSCKKVKPGSYTNGTPFGPNGAGEYSVSSSAIAVLKSIQRARCADTRGS